jgi:hypothetical protein
MKFKYTKQITKNSIHNITYVSIEKLNFKIQTTIFLACLISSSSNNTNLFGDLFPQHFQLQAIGLLIVVVEVEGTAGLFELKHLLQIETVNDFSHVDVKFSFVLLVFERPVLHDLGQLGSVLADETLEDLFAVGRLLVLEHFLGLCVQLLHLVLDPIVDTVVKDLKNIILLLDISPNILIVLLPDKLLPVLQPNKLTLIIHLRLQPLQHRQQLPYQQITDHIRNLDILPPVHSLLSHCRQEHVYVASVQDVGAVALEGFDLLLALRLLVLEYVLLALGLSVALDFCLHVH